MLTDSKRGQRTGVEVELRVPGQSSGLVVTLRPPRDVEHWEASEFTDEAREALGIPSGEKLYIKRCYEPKGVAERREKALAALRAKDQIDPTVMFGMVPLYAMGFVEDDENARKKCMGRADAITVYEVMQDAGPHRLDDVVRHGRPEVWGDDGQYAAMRAMVPVASTLMTIHSLTFEEWKYDSAAAHRDIKPANLFVAFEDEEQYPKAGEWEGPLVRLADYGLFYLSNLDFWATKTADWDFSSAFWTPWNITLKEGGEDNPKARDVWSFAATFFYAATGRHPWAQVDEYMHGDLSGRTPQMAQREAAEMMKASPRPDSPAFADLDPRLAEVLRACLGRHHLNRPRIESVAKVLWEVSQGYFATKAAAERAKIHEERAEAEHDAAPADHEQGSGSRRPGRVDLRIVGFLALAVFLFFGVIGAIAQFPPDPARSSAPPAATLGPSPSASSAPTQTASNPTTTPTASPTPTLDDAGVAVLIAGGFEDVGKGVWNKASTSNLSKCHDGDSTCAQIDAVTPLLKGCLKGVVGVALFFDKDGRPVDSAVASSGPLKPMQHVTLYFGSTKAAPASMDLPYLGCI